MAQGGCYEISTLETMKGSLHSWPGCHWSNRQLPSRRQLSYVARVVGKQKDEGGQAFAHLAPGEVLRKLNRDDEALPVAGAPQELSARSDQKLLW